MKRRLIPTPIKIPISSASAKHAMKVTRPSIRSLSVTKRNILKSVKNVVRSRNNDS